MWLLVWLLLTLLFGAGLINVDVVVCVSRLCNQAAVAVVKPKSAYQHFCEDNLRSVVASDPTLTNDAVLQALYER